MIEKSNKEVTLVDKANAAFEKVAEAVVERAKATATPVIIWQDGKCLSLSFEEAEQLMRQRSQNL